MFGFLTRNKPPVTNNRSKPVQRQLNIPFVLINNQCILDYNRYLQKSYINNFSLYKNIMRAPNKKPKGDLYPDLLNNIDNFENFLKKLFRKGKK